jgi:hypothetical protein
MSQEAMREALEALEWLRVAFKQNSQGRQVADSAIDALKLALESEPIQYDILDEQDQVIFTSSAKIEKIKKI